MSSSDPSITPSSSAADDETPIAPVVFKSKKTKGSLRKKTTIGGEEEGSNAQAATSQRTIREEELELDPEDRHMLPSDASPLPPSSEHVSINRKERNILSSMAENPLTQTTSKQSSSSSPSINLGAYEARRDIIRSGPSDQGATAVSEDQTDITKDARALYERNIALQKQREADLAEKAKAAGGNFKAVEKTYQGLNAYALQSSASGGNYASGGAGGAPKGPMRAPSNVRISCRFDYQPDTCKDYKETGYCGFGDACKFAHIREDYKTGWQIEAEWDQEQKKKREREKLGLRDDDDKSGGKAEDDLPFACFLCRNPFKNPVVTRCNHYFCEACAVAHFKKSKKCFVCNEPTQGIFNTAFDIIKKLEKYQAKRQRSGEEDEDEEDEDDEDEEGEQNQQQELNPEEQEEQDIERELRDAKRKKFAYSEGWAYTQ